MNRTLLAARLPLLTAGSIGWPWLNLVLAFLVSYAVFGSMGDVEGGARTGGIASVYLTVLVISANWVAQALPFALAVGLTRREFFTGTALLVAAQSVAYGVLLCLLRQAEQATGGWGIRMRFFAPPWIAQQNLAMQFLVYAVPFLVAAFLGSFVAVVHLRWRLSGVFVLVIGVTLPLGGLAAVVGWRDWWPAVLGWLFDQTAVSLLAGWSAVLAVALAGAGYLTLRRAAP
ncbi:hypothetical protein [Plantactinospora sp. KBS50]|uniref:hypothetical protein n=1 Tax=Plantactinospora sp. KBS50 TaxID=2024580 RepID=UPI000BAAB668|nr:hypothetical protein [Plantactinospora sp. KBS50]ASW56544.1 hypothetical protein CIK06_23860 [Plantactinospora sp. KBS50]